MNAPGAGCRCVDTDCDEGTGADRKLWSKVNEGPGLAVPDRPVSVATIFRR